MPESNRDKAIKNGLANAKFFGSPRYLHKYNGIYWSDSAPPTPGPMAGIHGSDYMAVYPDGHVEEYDPKVGPKYKPKEDKRADRTGDSKSDQTGKHRH